MKVTLREEEIEQVMEFSLLTAFAIGLLLGILIGLAIGAWAWL
jgi:ABC-type nitrate/sulfonate/bicarbonate transport system permease component